MSEAGIRYDCPWPVCEWSYFVPDRPLRFDVSLPSLMDEQARTERLLAAHLNAEHPGWSVTALREMALLRGLRT